MEHIAEILRGLIETVAHLMPPGRAGELHELANLVDNGAREVAEVAGAIADDTAPPPSPAPPVSAQP